METLAPAIPERAGLRRAGWLLALSPIGFVVVTAAGLATFIASGVDDTDVMTPQQMDEIRLGWLTFWPVYAAAVVFGLVAMAMLNTALRGTRARVLATASQGAVALSAASILATVVLKYAMLGFTEARLELNSLYGPSVWASMLSIWLAAVAVVLTGIGLRTSGVLRRTGLVVAIIAAGFVLVEVVVTRGAIPPFVVALLWLPLGIGLLRLRVPSHT